MDYLRQAEEIDRLADSATDAGLRRKYRELARQWRELARYAQYFTLQQQEVYAPEGCAHGVRVRPRGVGLLRGAAGAIVGYARTVFGSVGAGRTCVRRGPEATPRP